MFQTKVVEKNQNTQATVTFWRMPIACWITKATHTHRGCVILISFPLQQWLQECASLLHYMYIARLIGVTKDLIFGSVITVFGLSSYNIHSLACLL